jgi:CubicO group peptidase (beta-lactamase class C family)
MFRTAPSLGFFAALVLGALAGTPAQEPAQQRFPGSTAIAEGVSPEALAKVGALVQSLVDDEEIVGAELLVIKHGRTLLHEAFGWSDLEARVPMETGSVFCVRSMTKPLIGASILMLIEDDVLELDDHVAQFLPSYDADGLRDITIEHLLAHTSGLPFSYIAAADLQELESIQAVAARARGRALEFEPGSAFQYSDHGTDTLTAVIEAVSGAPAADFVRARVLAPLGMDDSACVLGEKSPLRARALPKYVGSRGAWTRFWSPDAAPLFPFFLGSQGLYATLEDYARFMDFWLKKGRAGREKLLGARYVRKALTPGPYPLGAGTGLPGLRVDYGFLMELWTRPGAHEEDAREVVVFGHNGSDGTHAWVFPEQGALVFYFTQSRNNVTGLRVEEVLGEVFLGVPFDPHQAAPPLEQYLGYYREDERDLYRAIVLDEGELALEVLGRGVVPLAYVGEDRWKVRPEPGVVLAFQRDESGAVTGFRIGDHEELRFEPSADLPRAEELAARVAAAHRIDLAETLGPLRIRSKLSIETLGIEGEVTSLLAWPDRFRVDVAAGEERESSAFDGEVARYRTSAQPTIRVLDGARAEVLRLEHLFARLGDWRLWYPELRVIQRIRKGDEDALLVRTGGTSAPATTFFIDARTGLVGRVASMTYIESLGRIGQQVTYRDYRDVSGMQLPHRVEVKLPNPMVGTIVSTVEELELGVALPEGVFELRDEQ